MTTAIMEFTAAALRRISTCFPFNNAPGSDAVADGHIGANRLVSQRYENSRKYGWAGADFMHRTGAWACGAMWRNGTFRSAEHSGKASEMALCV